MAKRNATATLKTDNRPIPFALGRIVASAPAQFVGLACQSLQPAKTAPRSGTFVSASPAANDTPPKPTASRRATFLVGNNSVEFDLDEAQLAELAADPKMVGDYEIRITHRAPTGAAAQEAR